MKKGHLHPISQVITQATNVFASMGFNVASGPEKESVFYNFDALNVPANHPARDMQDTFFIDETTVMRTHTSPVQVRYLESHKPPIRVVCPGKVFRNEATDATHEAQFHQIEAFYVDKVVTIGHLKGVIEGFLKGMFGDDVSIRFRPGFFPFTEPGLEVDMTCFKCKGEGCNVCKKTGWIEILGSGLIHPNVLQATGIDPHEWQGFAFGVGIDRIAMIKYGVDDIRLFYSGDMRFIEQF